MKEKVGGRGRGEHEEVGSSRGYLGGCGGGGDRPPIQSLFA